MALPSEQRLGRDAVLLITMHMLFQLGTAMAGVFMNLYLWRLTHSFWVSGMYNLVIFFMMPFAFSLTGWIAKKRHPLVPFRIGIMLCALFYLLVVILQSRVAHLYLIIAALSGLSEGTYWMGYWVLSYDVSSESTRVRYFGMNTATSTLAKLIGPASAGWIIVHSAGLSGYIAIFALAFITFSVSAFISTFMKARRSTDQQYHLASIPSLMRTNPGWTVTLSAFLVFGLIAGTMMFLPNLMLFRALGREDSVGYLTVVLSLMSMLSGFAQSRFGRPQLYRIYSIVAAVGILFSSVILVGRFSLLTVLIFLVAYSFFNPLQSNTLSSHYFSFLHRLPAEDDLRVEGMVMREIFLDLGRSLSAFVTISFAKTMNGTALSIVLLVLALTQLLLPMCLHFSAKQSLRQQQRPSDRTPSA